MMEPSSENMDGAPASSSHTTEPVDLASMPYSLHRAVHARRSEYTRPHRIRVKVGTWNVAACPGTDQDLATWFASGKGVDRRLATVDVTSNRAVERETTNDSLVEEEDPNAVRIVGGDKIGLYVLGLQEVVDLNLATQYVNRAAALPTLDKWKTALDVALPDGYQLVTTEQMAGLLLLVYASPEVAPTLSHVSTSAVGTGLLGMLGNKGAVSARIVLGEATRMVFINSHLSSGDDAYYTERRCWDVSQIESRTQFEPFNHPGVANATEPEKVGDEDFTFWFGDLNFRLDGLPGDDIRRILTLHARGEYNLNQQPSESNSLLDDPLDGEDAVILKKPVSGGVQSARASTVSTSSNSSFLKVDDSDGSDMETIKQLPPLPDPDDFLPDPADDPASLQATLESLLPHDQLHRVMKERKAFHDGWREGHIAFLPTYKYDVGTVGLFDSSDKQRPPSWCDRILYRTRKNKEDYQQRVRDEEEAKKKDEEMKARGLDHAGDDDEVLFEYQPDNDEDLNAQEGQPANYDYDEYDDGDDNTAEAEDAASQDGPSDHIHLDIYASHQRIQSSDHKPVVSVFTIDYNAVVPTLKAKVHSEVAKELDRAENEGRPGVTIVVDSRLSQALNAEERGPGEAVDFGSVQFLRKSVASLTIANTGRVPAVFSFVEKPTTEDLTGSHSTTPPYQWLATSFVHQDHGTEGIEDDYLAKEVTLEPGETVNALLEVFVDDLIFARMLNDGQGTLEDVLVLRVVDGRDHFIPVRGIWSPTCIGRSVEELIRVPDGGIRTFMASLLQGKNDNQGIALGSIPYESEVRCSAPKELFKLTEAIENLTDRVIADEQMLEECKIPADQPGWPFELLNKSLDNEHAVAIIDALDDDRPVLDAFEPEVPSIRRLEVVSRVLLLFLRGLTDGVVTIPLWSRIDQATLLSLGGTKNTNPCARDPSSEADKTTILDALTSAPHHNISFVFLTTTLSRIIAELSPLSLADLDTLRSISRASSGGFGAAIGGIGRRSLSSFRKGGTSASAALQALDHRQARERRYAEIFGKIICRAPPPAKDKDRKVLEDKQRAVVELFLRRSREELG